MGQKPTHLGNLCFMERVVLFTFQSQKLNPGTLTKQAVKEIVAKQVESYNL